MITITPRHAWGGPTEPIGHATAGAKPLVIIHHSYRPNREAGVSIQRERDDVLGMHRYHAEQDWGGISYQFLVFQSGHVYEGRGWGRVGAHTIGRNSSSVGICFVIDGEKCQPSDAALHAAEELIGDGIRRGHIAAEHRRAPHDEFKNKVCPGELVKHCGILGGRMPTLTRAAAAAAKPTLRQGKGGKDAPADIYEAVRELQRRLGMPDHLRTGFFGELTSAEVRAFQRRHKLQDDAIVGRDTWSALLA